MRLVVYRTLAGFPDAYGPGQRGYVFGTGKVVIFTNKVITAASIPTVCVFEFIANAFYNA
jgi:hypothetical protein